VFANDKLMTRLVNGLTTSGACNHELTINTLIDAFFHQQEQSVTLEVVCTFG
jgi:hypothetical protein